MSLLPPWLRQNRLHQNRMHGYLWWVTEQNTILLTRSATLQRAQMPSVKLARIKPSNATSSYKRANSLKKFISHGTSAFRGLLVFVSVLIPLVICRYYFISPYMQILQKDPSECPAAFFLWYSCARSKRISLACTAASLASQYMKRCSWVYTVGWNGENTLILVNSAGKVRRM